MLSSEFWHDPYSKNKHWPDEYKEWFFRTLAWNEMHKYVKGLRALRDAHNEEAQVVRLVWRCSCNQHHIPAKPLASLLARRLFFTITGRADRWVAQQVGNLYGP